MSLAKANKSSSRADQRAATSIAVRLLLLPAATFPTIRSPFADI